MDKAQREVVQVRRRKGDSGDEADDQAVEGRKRGSLRLSVLLPLYRLEPVFCLFPRSLSFLSVMQRKPDTHVQIDRGVKSRLWCRLCMDRSPGGWATATSKATCTTGRVWEEPKGSTVVYLRGVNGEDLSTFIKSVTFTLHASFRQNQRGARSLRLLFCSH